MKKTLLTALAVSFAASTAFAGGPGPATMDDDVENPFIAAPASSLSGGAGLAVAALVALAVAAGAGDSDGGSTTTSGS